MNSVRCNKCDWEGTEDDLTLYETKGDGTEKITAEETKLGVIVKHEPRPENPFYFKGCPNCKTDDDLIDIEL